MTAEVDPVKMRGAAKPTRVTADVFVALMVFMDLTSSFAVLTR